MTRHGRVLALLALVAGCGGPELAPLGPGADLMAPVTPVPAAAAPPAGAAPDVARRAPALPPRPAAYQIRSGDVLTISVFGEPDMTQTVPVGPDGRISYYVAHNVAAAGRTFDELRQELRERLREHFKDPQVTVAGHEFTGNTASVLGFVARPGQYVVRSDTRLLDFLAMAGGVSQARYSYGNYEGVELADLRRAYLLRDDDFVDVDFEGLFSADRGAVAANNVPVLAGDRVYVPSSSALENKVFVLGEVARPRVFRFQRDVSLLEAIAEAGGVVASAWERRAFVVRGSLRRPAVMPVNLRDVMTGIVPDVPLKSGDIVFVPKTALGKIDEIARQLLPFLQSAREADALAR